MAETILPKGVRMFNKHANAPDFVIAAMVITPKDLVAFCNDNPGLLSEYNGDKQLRLQVLKSKEGKIYCSVDTFKPTGGAVTQSLPGNSPAVEDFTDLPF